MTARTPASSGETYRILWPITIGILSFLGTSLAAVLVWLGAGIHGKVDELQRVTTRNETRLEALGRQVDRVERVLEKNLVDEDHRKP